MIPEREQRVFAGFEAALKCDPAGRDALLKDWFADDAELRGQVERLLAEDAEAEYERFLRTPDPSDHSASQEDIPTHERSGFDWEQNGGKSSIESPNSKPEFPDGLAGQSDYIIERELDPGGNSLVFLAKDRLMRRDVVLKVLGNGMIGRSSLERFQREIQAAALLNHDHIVRAFHATQLGNRIVLVMEYIDGLDLYRLVKAQGPLSVERACDYIRQAALGLEHAHQNKLVHRDIKPSNLMLTRQGGRDIVKVLDFGWAKVRSEAPPDWALTYQGQIVGTPDYIAPEQITDARKADIRADIYSLGATLYYLLSGRPPFQGTNLYDILGSHKKATAKPLNLVRPDVPKALADLVAKMMAKKPARRFQTPAEVASALTAFLEPNTNPTESELSSPSAPHLRWAAAGLLLISLVFAVILIFKTKNGTIVFENLPEQSVVTADGEKLNVEWPESRGKGHAKITIPPGKHAVEVKVKGVRVSGEEVSVRSGGVTRFVVRFDPGIADREKLREAAPAPKQYKKTANTEMVMIPPGEFNMGSEIGPPGEDDRPRHLVKISKSFYLGVYEVTQELYEKVTGKNPSHFSNRPQHPVESVTWIDAVTFCNMLSQLEKIPPYYRINPNNEVTILGGKGYRLPTEAEWEYACRAGNPKDLPFWNDHELGEVAWMWNNSGRKTHPVGEKPANDFGLHDIHGNVWEWCWDWVGPYPKNPSVDPRGPNVGKFRVLRGNAWYNGDYFSSRPSFRLRGLPEGTSANHDFGFRVAADGPL